MATAGKNTFIPACACLEPELCDADIDDSSRFLLGASDAAKRDFARRQLRARRRTTQLLAFYHAYRCHMARLHILASCAVTLGRLCGYSKEFDEMGELFMPVTAEGAPRTPEWAAYMQACGSCRPMPLRDELWISAHMRDMEKVQSIGLDHQFYAEAGEHSRDPMWTMVRRHMEVTLGSRLMDSAALAGDVAPETAIAFSLLIGVKRLFSQRWELLRYFAKETARAVVSPARGPERTLESYRSTALELMRNSVLSWAAYRTYQRGVKAKGRGSERSDAHWPLLEEGLGSRIGQVHPLIVEFYSNPARFHADVNVRFSTLPARLASIAATLLLGQGLYETQQERIETRFRAFRRADGSLHFLREFYCAGSLRAFDSDFVIRELRGVPRLFEIFSELNLAVVMRMEPLPDGGLLISGEDIFYRGMRLPSLGLQVEFRSHVVEVEGQSLLQIKGKLLMKPRSAAGTYLIRRLMRRPEELGAICYLVRSLPADAAAAS
jgi:Domain of unknown function (DUF4166)